MSGLHRIEQFLADNGIAYDVLPHQHSASSMETARLAHIDPHALVKAVLLESDDGLVAAMHPASQQVSLGRLRQDYGGSVRLSDPKTIRSMFGDCDAGTMPSLTTAWGIDMVWDEELMQQPDLCRETGDHLHLIHLETRRLMTALGDTPHCHFGTPRRLH